MRDQYDDEIELLQSVDPRSYFSMSACHASIEPYHKQQYYRYI